MLTVGLCVAPVFLRGLRHPWRLLFPGTFKPRAPDLRNCTRITIEYRPSIQERFFGDSSFLNHEEQQYVKSLESIVIDDPNDFGVQMLAVAVEFAEYLGMDWNLVRDGVTEYAEITGYAGPNPKDSFVVRGDELTIRDGRVFQKYRNPEFPRCMSRIRNRHVPFQDRIWCAALRMHIREPLRDAMGGEDRYPPPAEWCDIMDEYKRTRYPSRERITWGLKCPAQKGRCHYAMNPNCEPNSPADMVLLFETKAGWNQHGGPELFTFDNHDPKGGCVLLNDGTVKFIRTEEELKQLRWK